MVSRRLGKQGNFGVLRRDGLAIVSGRKHERYIALRKWSATGTTAAPWTLTSNTAPAIAGVTSKLFNACRHWKSAQ